MTTEYSLLMCEAEGDKGGVEVTAFVDDDPVCGAKIIDLVAEWADMESIDGELHPYLDGTLNVLSDMTYALIKVVQRMEKDDPHRAVLLKLYTEAYNYAQTLVDRLSDD